VIDAQFPAVARLRRAMKPEIRKFEARLDQEETAGKDTASWRLTLRELRWRLEYTADAAAIAATYDRLHAAISVLSLPDTAARGGNGNGGFGTDVWFLQLDALADQMLAADFDNRGELPSFLDRVNHPCRLKDYLEGLQVSRPVEDGIDRRKELNFATAALVRLILRRRPGNYFWNPRLEIVLRQFLAAWQDPVSGFFGADYLIGSSRLRTVDLSLTFHMARYLEGRIEYWPQLIDTLFGMRGHRYPHGWLDETGMTCHNNYDVAVLLQLGWLHMRADQRRCAREELGRLLDWCLTAAVAPDGGLLARAVGESVPESYYFAVAFLDTVGYFDPATRFWSDRSYPDAPELRAGIERHLQMLPLGDPMVRMAFERLGLRCTAANRPA
jgi:hypothetical protein